MRYGFRCTPGTNGIEQLAMGRRLMRVHRFNRFGLIPRQNGINDREMLISGYNIAIPALGNIPRKMIIEYQRYFTLKADYQPPR